MKRIIFAVLLVLTLFAAVSDAFVPDDPRAAAVYTAKRLQDLRDRRAALRQEINEAEVDLLDKIMLLEMRITKLEVEIKQLERRLNGQ